MTEELPSTTIIPNEMCRRAGVAATFSSSSEFVVFPSQHVKQKDNAPAPYVTTAGVAEEAVLYAVRKEVVLFHTILRRLVNEAAGIFACLQTHTAAHGDAHQLYAYSTQYRAVIRANLEDLQRELAGNPGPHTPTLKHYVTIFYSIECVWHLVETLHIQPNPDMLACARLLDWVRFHIPKYEREAARMIHAYKGGRVAKDDNYWRLVIGCVLQARIGEALQLLAMQPDDEAFVEASQLLAAMPTPHAEGGYVGGGHHVFGVRRKNWLIDVQVRLDAGRFAREPHLAFILQLAVGEENAWSEVVSHCEVWYELLAAWLFYTDPLVKTYALGKYARICLSRMRTRMRHIDYMLLAVMEKEASLLEQMQHFNENGWFITHLGDLLYHAGELQAWLPPDECAEKLHDVFNLEYGVLLMGHRSLWQTGLVYLDHSRVQGTAAIHTLLPRWAVDEQQALRVIQAATKRGLTMLAVEVARVQCRRALRVQRPGNALCWAMKAQDPEYLDHVAHMYLHRIRNDYSLPDADLLAHLGGAMLLCDSLIFIGKYYEYRLQYKARSYEQAAATLVGLIGSKFTPEFFCRAILGEVIRLMESDVYQIDANSTMVIMNYLDERANTCEGGDQSEADQVRLLRTTLARNLARVSMLTTMKPLKATFRPLSLMH